jgi:hypothetical protein
MSFLDNLEDNLKALESQDQGGLDQSRRRETERARALAVAPWAERLKREPYAKSLIQQATIAGRQRRTKVNLAWIDTTLRLEARAQRLELRPQPDGVVAVFLQNGQEVSQQPIDLSSDPQGLTNDWMAALDEQKRIDDQQIDAAPPED